MVENKRAEIPCRECEGDGVVLFGAAGFCDPSARERTCRTCNGTGEEEVVGWEVEDLLDHGAELTREEVNARMIEVGFDAEDAEKVWNHYCGEKVAS